MKKFLLFSIILFSLSKSNAQDLANDQNPNFKVSMDKYMGIKDSLMQNMNTTVHNTYAAPDWYERRMQRRADRRSFRRQLRLAEAQNPYNRMNYSLGWNNGWNNNWNWNGGWNNGWNSWNNWGWNNNACIRIGNFMYCF